MSSPGGKRRPVSTSGYEPLLRANSSEKPKPPPKPKPQFFKSNSATLVDTTTSADVVPGGYFEPGGSTGNVGYCLSSVYKTKKTSSEYMKPDKGNTSIKPQEIKTRFMSKDKSRPPMASLPAKFRISFDERNQQKSEPASGVLVPISESANSVIRRPPPPIPTDTKHRMSNPLPTTISKSLQKQLDSTNSKCSSLERNLCFDTSLVSPTTGTLNPSSPSSVGSSSPKMPITFAQPPPRELEYIEREHPKNAFLYLEKFRHKGELCDVTLLVNGKELKAHRVVLAACSQYFESMFIGEFAEPLDEPIVIEEISDDTLQTLVDFAYTSRIKLTEKNVYSIFEAADLLQFCGIRGACFKFFKHQINKSNCIRTWLFAQSHNCTELLDASLKYIECNFLDIAKGREFLELDQPEVVMDIASREDLAITSEEQVYEAVLLWIKSRLDTRRKHSLEVFKSVRFSSMSKESLMYIVDNESLIKEDPDLLQLLIDALESHVTIMRGTLRKKAKPKTKDTSMDPVLRPRAASMAIEVVDIHRQNTLLGLRIMGGKDHPQHVFRQGDKPGIFILQILDGSAAARTKRLKRGDRILMVNDEDMTKVTHEEAIRILRICSDPSSFAVRHEPPPLGLQELTLVTKPGEGFGFGIAGGVNSYLGNPLDETDEGIFISQIIPGGAAEQDDRLRVGTRILQVNSVSMLGKTNEEALKILQGVLDRLNLLVCDGYDPDSVIQTSNSASYEFHSLEGESFL